MNRRGMLTLGLLTLLAGPTAAGEHLQRFAPGAAGGKTFDHGPFERVLGRYVHASSDGVNRVDYRAWKSSARDLESLRAYIREVEAQNPRALTHAEQFAYWANLYNAETLRVVLAAYPIKSILLIHPILFAIGPWKKPTLVVAGVALSLDEVENGILRPLFGDPRGHYALNCASTSCPNLRPIPWSGATLDSDLDAAAQAYVNHPRGVRVAAKGLTLSSIYKWYRADFGGSDASVLAHLRRYARGPLAARLDARPAIIGYDYDWSLNDTASEPR